jgi:hypothetical protein
MGTGLFSFQNRGFLPPIVFYRTARILALNKKTCLLLFKRRQARYGSLNGHPLFGDPAARLGFVSKLQWARGSASLRCRKFALFGDENIFTMHLWGNQTVFY